MLLLKFHDITNFYPKNHHFEMTYTSVIKLNEEIKDKKALQKIILFWMYKRNLSRIRKGSPIFYTHQDIQILNLKKKLILKNFFEKQLIKEILPKNNFSNNDHDFFAHVWFGGKYLL